MLDDLNVVADDLSGAADCAAAFARRLGPVPVHLRLPVPGRDQRRFSFDADTRAMDSAAAVKTTDRIFRSLATRHQAGALVFKKIDSTLRGHLGAELRAALCALKADAVVVAPAFPHQGRFIRDGQLFLTDGLPNSRTGQIDLCALLNEVHLRPAVLTCRPDEHPKQLAQRIVTAHANGARAIVIDASDQEDLTRLASGLMELTVLRVLVAGSAGLASALAARMGESNLGIGADWPVAGRHGVVAAVVGSFSTASAAQVLAVEQRGDVEVLRCDVQRWLHGRVEHEVSQAKQAFASGRHVLFASHGGRPDQPSRAIVQSMARSLIPLLALAGAWVLTGGDTARAVLEAVGMSQLLVVGEFEPGISVALPAGRKSPLIVIKAGGFGDPLALVRLLDRLDGTAHSPSEMHAAINTNVEHPL